jgi:tRNA-Thr(GGU) m(6)t(6)A37 methyltransferase TsaA
MESIHFIGKVHSSLKNLGDCPLQKSEGAPAAEIEIDKEYLDALTGLKTGSSILVLTWLHKGNRSTLTTRPRNNPNAKMTGVFATRSPDRPNPIGLHEAKVVSIDEDGKIRLSQLEVVDGTPVIDIKIAL